MSKKPRIEYDWNTDSEDYVRFVDGYLSVEEDGSSARTIKLTRRVAEVLGMTMIDWSKK